MQGAFFDRIGELKMIVNNPLQGIEEDTAQKAISRKSEVLSIRNLIRQISLVAPWFRKQAQKKG